MAAGADPEFVQAILGCFAADPLRPGAVDEALAAYLRRTNRQPRTDAEGYPAKVGEGVSTLRSDLRRKPALDPFTAAYAIARAVEAGTEPVPDPAAIETRLRERVRVLDRRLHETEAGEPAWFRAAGELLEVAPTSAYAMSRALDHLADLAAAPPPRAVRERLVWVAATETIGMADGDVAMVERGVDAALRLGGRGAGAGPVGLLRTVWSLLRLERLDEGLALLRRSRSHMRDPVHAAWADGLEAYAHHYAGHPEDAIEAGRRAAARPGAGSMALLGRAHAARALLADGRVEAARLMVDVELQATLGGNALRVTTAEVELASGRPAAALARCEEAADQLRRAGVRNPAGWPWRRIMIEAALALDRRVHAVSLLDELTLATARWPTPLVRAELLRAHAALAELPEARQALLREAAGALAGGEARAEHARVSALAGLTVGPPAAPGQLAALTRRGHEVADLVAQGLRDREIAERLGLSVRTVHRHVGTALRAVGARNRAELARMVAEGGPVPVSPR